MKNNLDKLRIELYGNGIFQGYVKSVSLAKNKVTSTNNKMDAKTYGKQSTAKEDVHKIMYLTSGALTCNII